VCLTEISKRPRRVLPAAVGEPGDEASGEPVWITPYPDQTMGIEDGPASPEGRYELRESIELAFIAALQHLPANQRAALILRDVLGFRAREVADALETTTAAAVNSALQRAHRTVETRVPDRSQQAMLRSLGDDRLRAIVSDYTAALEEEDVDAIVAMLAKDATWSMPPHPAWYQGHEAIMGFFMIGPATVRWRHLPTTSNGQIAVGCYAWNEEAGVFRGPSSTCSPFADHRSPRSQRSSTARCSPDSACRKWCPREWRHQPGSALGMVRLSTGRRNLEDRDGESGARAERMGGLRPAAIARSAEP
jgi:RNA polymerase sigma-70 factor (ECF subfamily)